MVISQYPAGSSGISTVVNSIQRGVAASATTVTISSVNVNKTQVTSFSTGAAGSAAVNGSVRLKFRNVTSPSVTDQAEGQYDKGGSNRYGFHHSHVGGQEQAISGGTSTLTAAAHGAYLSGATSLVVTGPCRYEIVEYV